MNSELEKLKGPVEYIKEAWGIYIKKENFIRFARIMSVLTIASISIGYLFNYLFPTDFLRNPDFSNTPMLIGFIVLSTVSGLLGLWSKTVTNYAIIKMDVSEKEIFNMGYKMMFKFLLITFVGGLIILGGTLLLIVPGIIFGTWFAFSAFLVLDKKLGIIEALKISKSMVKDKFWKLLGRFFVFGLFTFLITIVLSSIPYVGSILLYFVAPFYMLPYYLLYKDLSEIKLS